MDRRAVERQLGNRRRLLLVRVEPHFRKQVDQSLSIRADTIEPIAMIEVPDDRALEGSRTTRCFAQQAD